MDQIKQLPKTPTLPSNTTDDGKSLIRALWDHIIQSNETVNKLIKQVLGLKPADIGAAATEQEAWRVPTLVNGWVNYGGVYAPASYYKDNLGIVHLRGCVKSGTIGLKVFTLPIGYRPSFSAVFVTSSNALQGQLIVEADGDVILMIGSNASFFLDGISFRAEA